MKTINAINWRRPALLSAALALLPVVAAAWVSVGNGIEYQQFTTPDPNNVYVCRMSRTNANATLETMTANGKLSGGRQVTSGQAAIVDGSVSWWGQEWGARNDVVCAINGAYETELAYHPDGQQILSGWYAKRISEWGWSGFGWTVDRLPFIGGCVHTTSNRNYITVLPEGSTVEFDNVNTTRGTDNVIIYTPQYDATTLTDNTGVEWVVKMDRPTLILPAPDRAEGTVTQVRVNQGSTPIPWDCIVISATGSRATTLQSYLSVGKRIGVTQYFLEYQPDCNTPKTNNWTKTFASIGGNVTFLRDGQVVHNYQSGMIVRNPRTCICYNADYVFYVVCDGRTTASVGWTNDEMAAFCLNTLGATDGINEDGGGSSVMVVNGKIMNVPSDGSERAVVNGTTMVNIKPKLQSSTFSTGQTVTVNTNSTAVRLGPGTNYASTTTKNKNATGTIASDTFNGLYAKGFFWWKVDFGDGTVGWIAETLISSSAGGPTIVQHPQAQSSCYGNSVKFEVVAQGKATLTYRWQKNNVNLSNGGHYSGVLTPKLIITGIDANDMANYRCAVTDSVSTVYTNNAALTQGAQPDPPAAQPATNISADSITWNWSIVPSAQSYQLWTASSGGAQIGGVIQGNFYTETDLNPGTSYTRYVASVGCGTSATRTQLGPASTTARYCAYNADWENGFINGIGAGWTKIADDGTSVFSQETSIVHGGTNSQKIYDPSGGQAYTGWIYQRVNVQPNRLYQARYWHYHTGISGQTAGIVTAIGCDVNGGTTISTLGESSGPLDQWLIKRTTFTSGAGGVVTVGIRAGYNNGGSTAYVDDLAVVPAPPTASGGTATISAGQTATLTASGGFGGSSTELHWYSGPEGTGSHIGTGTTLIVSPSSTTTYYPRWESSLATCSYSEDGPSVTITVIPLPAPAITSITPSSGPNSGSTSITNLAGTGFVTGASVSLKRTGQSDIAATGVNVQSATKITCSLDLAGKKPGLWDVVVTNPDTQSGTLASGFGVKIAGTADLVGTTIASLLRSPATAGSANYRFCVWGVVETIDTSTFWLDDGSGSRIRVFAPGYTGITNGGFASARGTVDVSVSPPVLISDSVSGH
jgi:hypothetical protein